MANYVRVPFLEIKSNQLLPYIITFEPKKIQEVCPWQLPSENWPNMTEQIELQKVSPKCKISGAGG